MQKQISSFQNPAIKKILQLQEKSRFRRKTGLFVIEGIRELQLALKADYELAELYFCPELFSLEQVNKVLKTSQKPIITEISKELYQKIAYRGSTGGILAVAYSKELSLENLMFSKPNALILVAEAPEKPGNIGALLRTADAANLDAVLIANPETDMYNPNIIRSSVGCLFTNNLAVGSSSEIIAFLQQHNVSIFCAVLQAAESYQYSNFKQSSAIVVGTEASGLNPIWLENSNQNIFIPMQGQIDSMNVSVAAGILIFEAKRQRNFE